MQTGSVQVSPPGSRPLDPVVLSAAAASLVATGSITFLIDDGALTYSLEGPAIRADSGRIDGATAVRLSGQAWADVVGQLRTFVNLQLAGELVFERGGFDQLADWEPVLRYLHAGIRPYDPATVDLGDRDPLASFPCDTDDAELRAQLQTMGYLHVTGVFSDQEMSAANDEVDRLAAMARPGDELSWWVAADDGTTSLCRLVYATLRSPTLAALQDDPRIRRLGTLLDPTLTSAPDRMEGSAVLLKVPGKTSGLSNIPWHQDCGLGGHGIMCPAVGVGIQLTGSNSATGNVQFIPGSHGQAVHHRWNERFDGVSVAGVDTRSEERRVGKEC